jgi:hypothetical protein
LIKTPASVNGKDSPERVCDLPLHPPISVARPRRPAVTKRNASPTETREEAIVSANPTSNHGKLRRAWRRAIRSLPANRRLPEVRNFGRFCERRGVGPSAFGEAEVADFAESLFERGCADAAKRARALRHQLNAARASHDWPGPP